jgi:DNA-binding transcriptional LysR family regulator
MTGGAFFAPVVGAFRDRYPNVELKMVEDGARAIESSVRNGLLEIGAAVLPVDNTVFESLSLVRDRLCLIAPTGSPWHGMDSVTLLDIADRPLVFYPEDFSLSARITDAFRLLGKSVHIAGRSAHWDFIAAMVEARLGIALLPEVVASHLEPHRFDVVPVDEERIMWHIGLIWKKDSYLSHAARAWITLTREILLPGH